MRASRGTINNKKKKDSITSNTQTHRETPSGLGKRGDVPTNTVKGSTDH